MSPPGDHIFTLAYIGKHEKIFFLLSLVESAVRSTIKAVFWAA